jgi:hypothetical protein
MAIDRFDSKSAAIQDYLLTQPNAGPAQIVAALKNQGIQVSLGLAKVVKYGKGKKRSATGSGVQTDGEATGAQLPAKTKISGSESIRQFIARHPDATPKQIESGLKAEGVVVKLGLINAVKYTKKNKNRTGAGSRRIRGVDGSADSALPSLVARLLAVKKFAESMGGIAELRMMLDLIEQLR